MVNKYKSTDDGRNYFTNIFYSLFGKKIKTKKLQFDENTDIKEQFSMKNEPMNKKSRRHYKCRPSKKKRQRDKCNSNTSPLLRYFRLWCPCFCCCKSENKARACCECCPYQRKYEEKYRKEKLPDEDYKPKSVNENSKKKSSKSKKNNDSKNKSNSKLTNKCSQKQQSNNEINNKSGSEKMKSVIFACCPSKTDAVTKTVQCNCANRSLNIEFYPPDRKKKRQKQNGIPYIRKRN